MSDELPVRDPRLCRFTLAAAMNCHEAGPILNTVHLFPGNSFSQLRALNDVLAAVGELASEGLLPVRDHVGKLVERLHSRRGEPPDTWEKIVEEILALKGADNDPRWWAGPCFDRTMRWELSELAKAAGNDLNEGDIFTRIRALQERAAQIDRLDAADAEPFPLLDLSAELPPAPEPLVGTDSDQLAMPREKIGVVGDPEAGKSNLLVAMGLGIASGRSVLGFGCQQRPVAYATSDGDPDFERRVKRVWWGLGGDPQEQVPFRAMQDDAFNISELSCLARVRATLNALGAKERPAVFILESLATNVPDADVLKDQARFREHARLFGELQREFPGLTIFISAHFRKFQQGGANDLGTRVAGTMQIRAGFDAIIGVVSAGKDSCCVKRVKRSRSGGNFRDFLVRFVGERSEPLRLENAGTREVSVEEARGAAAAVMAYFRPIVGPKPLKDIVAALFPNFKERTVQTACKKLAGANPPFLVARGQKPLAYERVKSGDGDELDFRGLD